MILLDQEPGGSPEDGRTATHARRMRQKWERQHSPTGRRYALIQAPRSQTAWQVSPRRIDQMVAITRLSSRTGTPSRPRIFISPSTRHQFREGRVPGERSVAVGGLDLLHGPQREQPLRLGPGVPAARIRAIAPGCRTDSKSVGLSE